MGNQIEHLSDGILIYQSNYIEKVQKRFNMDKAHLMSSLMVVQSHDAIKDIFHHQKDNEDIFSPKVSYLGEIGALIYLAN